jgi:hypothetical protein
LLLVFIRSHKSRFIDHLGEQIHQLYLEWAILNGVRVLLAGTTSFFLFKAYRNAIKRDLG